MTLLETSGISLRSESDLLARDTRSNEIGQAITFLPAGKEIYAQGEKCGNLYKVEFGAVRIYRLLTDGRRQIAALDPGSLELAGWICIRPAHKDECRCDYDHDQQAN